MKIKYFYLNLLIILVSNLLPLFYVFLKKWSVLEILLLYWLEVLIICVFNIFRIVLNRKAEQKAEDKNDFEPEFARRSGTKQYSPTLFLFMTLFWMAAWLFFLLGFIGKIPAFQFDGGYVSPGADTSLFYTMGALSKLFFSPLMLATLVALIVGNLQLIIKEKIHLKALPRENNLLFFIIWRLFFYPFISLFCAFNINNLWPIVLIIFIKIISDLFLFYRQAKSAALNQTNSFQIQH